MSLDGAAVCSDLGFSAMADQALEELNFDHLDAFVVCGGLRVELQTPPQIIRFLRQPELRKRL